ncbi:hypothetical protein M8J77_007267 [Diaphorina citri]|nr:hypothetical protein M8J77_007267 [Diaphorina citri]KAI5727814.1 hypothetical protein M8J77_007267 [Diaphorina citri]
MTNGGKHMREENKEPVSTEEVTPSSTEDAEMKEERKSHLVPVIIPSSTPTSSSSVPRSIIAFQRQVSLDGTTTTTAKSVIMQKAAGGATKLTASSSGGNASAPRMSIPFALTGSSASHHYVPILSETDKPGVLKLEGIKILNPNTTSGGDSEHPTILVQNRLAGNPSGDKETGNREPTISTQKMPSTILNIPSDVIDNSRKLNLFNSTNIKAIKSSADFKNALIINSDKQIQNIGDKISSLMSSELDARPHERKSVVTNIATSMNLSTSIASSPIILHTRMSGGDGMGSPKLIRIERRPSGTDKESSFIPLSSIIAQKTTEVSTSSQSSGGIATSSDDPDPPKDTRNVLLKQLLKNAPSLPSISSSNDKISEAISSALNSAKEMRSPVPPASGSGVYSSVTKVTPLDPGDKDPSSDADNRVDSSQSQPKSSVSSTVLSLEEQLDKPVSPTSSLIPPLIINENLLKKPSATSSSLIGSSKLILASAQGPKGKPKAPAASENVITSSSAPQAAPSTTTIVVIQQVPQLAQMEAATTVPPTTTTTTTRVPVMSETTGSKFIFSQPNHTGMTQIIALSNAQAQKILKHDARGAQNQPILVAFTQPQSAAASIDTVTSQAQMTARRESPSPIKIIQSRPVTPETQAPSSGNVSQGSQVETSQQMPALVTTSSGTLSQSALKSQQSTFNIILQQQQQQFKLKFQQQQAKPTPKQASPQPSPSTTPQPPEPRPSAESNGSNSSSVGKRVEPNGAGSVGKRAESSTPPQPSPSPQFIKFGQSQSPPLSSAPSPTPSPGPLKPSSSTSPLQSIPSPSLPQHSSSATQQSASATQISAGGSQVSTTGSQVSTTGSQVSATGSQLSSSGSQVSSATQHSTSVQLGANQLSASGQLSCATQLSSANAPSQTQAPLLVRCATPGSASSMPPSPTSSQQSVSPPGMTSGPPPLTSPAGTTGSSQIIKSAPAQAPPTSGSGSLIHHHFQGVIHIKKEFPSTTSSTCTTSAVINNVATGMPPLTSSSGGAPLMEVKKEEEDSLPALPEVSPSVNHLSSTTAETAMDPQDLKKLKRRQYQQKRRQSQTGASKEAAGAITAGTGGPTPKKRPRKSSRLEEDYDTFVDSLMTQLRTLCNMTVIEPSLGLNLAVCNPFGCGDLTKPDINFKTGELKGVHGKAWLPTESDYYSTEPFGDLAPIPCSTSPSTQRGFYDEEFAPLKFDSEYDERKLDLSRDVETPDSVISSSSPECVLPEHPAKYPGLRLIHSDDEMEDDTPPHHNLMDVKRHSPVIPLVVPIAVRPRPGSLYLKLNNDQDKENIGCSTDPRYPKYKGLDHHRPGTPLRDTANVFITLTVCSDMAQDVTSTLAKLSELLNIRPPAQFKVSEHRPHVVPPSAKLGLYRNKSKDGKEGVPVNIQSILNGEAKFCRHCDVIVLHNPIRKSAADLPLLAKEDGSEWFYFCSSHCYTQLALHHLPPSATGQDKVNSVVDHLGEPPSKKLKSDKSAGAGAGSADPKHKLALGGLSTDLPPDMLLDSDDESSRGSGSEDAPKRSLKGIKYRVWASHCVPPPAKKYKRSTDKEMMEMLFRMGITVMPPKIPDDSRACLLCGQVGDGVADGPSRLLNYDVDKWVHLNCALWSNVADPGVYETVSGALMNVEKALEFAAPGVAAGLGPPVPVDKATAEKSVCSFCNKRGASLRCDFNHRCNLLCHLPCAIRDEWVFYKNKKVSCKNHAPKSEKDNELTTLAVYRRVYINRDENRQVASIMHLTEHSYLLRVGGLIFLNVGQLLPHQLDNFHTPDYIYPIGYKVVRFYWSMRVSNKRCRYVCSIHEVAGRPEFRVLVQENGQDDLELRDSSARAVWTRILEPLAALRRAHGNIQMFPKFISGEDLFGLNEPAIVRVLESLPGIESLPDYKFKFGRNPLFELPLAINPSGCARSEPRQKTAHHFKPRAHTQRTNSCIARPVLTQSQSSILSGDATCPYSKHFVHSKSSQYKKMKQEWRNNVYLARSKIQGLGLYAARDIERHTMVIEYIGEIIRSELSDFREKQYEAKNRGIYMFRLDEDRVVDATLCGGLARYINHSCNPNCVTETVEVDRELRIIIFAKRKINRGEEVRAGDFILCITSG